MAHKIKESLMYDFNYNLFLAQTMLSTVRNIRDRETVIRWLRFLKIAAKSVDEMKLRNSFMYYLVLMIREGTLTMPFDKPPPNAPLLTMVSMLPSDLDVASSRTKFRAPTAERKSEHFHRAPDGGEFILTQPPDVGAFCYMAVVTKKRK